MARFCLTILVVFLSALAPVIVHAGAGLEERHDTNLYPVVQMGKWGYTDRTGKIVIEPDYLYAGYFSEGLGALKTEAGVGYVDTKGAWVIPPRFESGQEFSEGLAAVLVDDKWGFCDRAGDISIEPAWDEANPFSDGLGRVKSGDKVLYLDHEGEVALESPYKWSDDFSCGLARVREGGMFGFIDKSGALAIPLDFSSAGRFCDGLTSAQPGPFSGNPDSPRTLIDTGGNFVFPPGPPWLLYEGGGLVKFASSAMFNGPEGIPRQGFMDLNGETVIGTQFLYSTRFELDRAAGILPDGDLVILDKTGKTLFTPHFMNGDRPDYMELKDGLVHTMHHERKVILDRNFFVHIASVNEIINLGGGFFVGFSFSFENNEIVYHYLDSDGRVLVKVQRAGTRVADGRPAEGLYAAPEEGDNPKLAGYKNLNGEWRIQPGFDFAYRFWEGLANVRVQGLHGYIDQSGKYVIKPQFNLCKEFHEGRAGVEMSGKWGFIDRTGEIVVSTMFEGVGDYSEGLAAVKVDGKWGFVSPKGIMLVKPKFLEVKDFHDGLAAVRENELWGYINRLGTWVIRPEFKRAGDFSDGLAMVGYNHSSDVESVSGLPLAKFAERSDLPLDPNYKDWTWWIIDKRGKKAIARDFPFIGDFADGVAPVCIKDGQHYYWEYVDSNGRIVSNGRFRQAHSFRDGYAVVELPQRNGWVNMDGEVVWQPTY